MVFSSNVFLLYFMPAFFLVYFLMPRKIRNYVLLLASLIFYAWGAPEFIIQLIASTVANFFLVKWMCKTEKTGLKKFLCGLSIIIPIGLLLFYKYGNFTMENLNAILGLTGHAPLTWKRIMLPIGISFFSFQSVTYTLDTYRGVNKPMEKLTDFVLYITMFPQLIAGPIIRYCDVADQIRSRESTMDDRLQGFYRFVIGLCKKILIADVIGAQVDAILGPANFSLLDADQISNIFTKVANLDSTTAWIVSLAYTFQIYFDFAGYSDMAIGLGRIMGFKFPENFDNPYTSRSITEFWRRWHKTLGAFIMNYLYIPLGGNRKGKGRMYFNLALPRQRDEENREGAERHSYLPHGEPYLGILPRRGLRLGLAAHQANVCLRFCFTTLQCQRATLRYNDCGRLLLLPHPNEVRTKSRGEGLFQRFH